MTKCDVTIVQNCICEIFTCNDWNVKIIITYNYESNIMKFLLYSKKIIFSKTSQLVCFHHTYSRTYIYILFLNGINKMLNVSLNTFHDVTICNHFVYLFIVSFNPAIFADVECVTCLVHIFTCIYDMHVYVYIFCCAQIEFQISQNPSQKPHIMNFKSNFYIVEIWWNNLTLFLVYW